jgi:hypothetical protein
MISYHADACARRTSDGGEHAELPVLPENPQGPAGPPPCTDD